MQQQQQLVESQRVQELVHLEKEVTLNEALVAEREQAICKIHQEITEINEIFRDLARLVHGQHEAMEVLECNLGAVSWIRRFTTI
jgi:syntaxin 7